MTIVAGDILQAVANFTLPDGELAKNVYYMQITDLNGATQAAIKLDIKFYLDAIYTALGNNVSNQLIAGIYEYYRRNTATDQWDREGGATSTYASANPADPVGNQETGVVFAKTANSRVTARKSFAGLIQNELTVNTWSVAAQNGLSGAAIAWINPPNDRDAQLVAGCWSTKNNEFFPFTGAGITRAFSGSMDTRKP